MAAVWCNVIALPIHLFKQSALYAIGSLLGKPIQIDHATANKSRLSFVRLCVEIDISKSPSDEIVLDILGKEMAIKVKWDKIPLYCNDCRHVGHASSTCYAFGKREMPAKRTFYPPTQKPHNPRTHKVQQNYKATGNQGGCSNGKGRETAHTDGKSKTHVVDIPGSYTSNGGEGQETSTGQRSNLGTNSLVDDDGFQKQGRRRGKNKQGGGGFRQLARTNSADGGRFIGETGNTLEKVTSPSSPTERRILQGSAGYLEATGVLQSVTTRVLQTEIFPPIGER